MNPIDLAVWVIVGICVLFGLYRGFFHSLIRLAGTLLSTWFSFQLYPKLSSLLSTNTAITSLIATYTDSNSLLGNLDLSSMKVSGLSANSIASIVQQANLPAPLDNLLSHNLQQQVFSPLGDLATTVGDYVNQTILSVSLNVICYLICFLLCMIACHLITGLLRSLFRLPVLKHLDVLMGGVAGFALGMIICYVVFASLPIIQSVVKLDAFNQIIEQSSMAHVFSNSNMLVSIMNRHL